MLSRTLANRRVRLGRGLKRAGLRSPDAQCRLFVGIDIALTLPTLVGKNLGHEHVLTTFTSYGNVSDHRHAEIILRWCNNRQSNLSGLALRIGGQKMDESRVLCRDAAA
jgi:hypothetical protein